MSRARLAASALGVLALLHAGPAARAHPAQADVAHEVTSAAPGSYARGFDLPDPGTYELPAIARVADAPLLDSSGAQRPLLGLEPGQAAIVSFVYTRCPDGHGCPAVVATLQRVDRLLAADPMLASRVRLVTVSFDPEYDTPERLSALRDALRPRADWRFLTAPDPATIAPVLADFGQDALALSGPDGRPLGIIRHVLKVFLVDAAGAVRNIYSSGFLDPELLLVDVRTVVGDSPPRPRVASPPPAP